MLLRPGAEGHDYWFMFSGIDKVLHVAIFMLLGFTFAVAFPKVTFLRFLIIMFIYAFVTEILQDEMNLGRTAESLDIVADIVGVFLGYILYNKTRSVSF